MHRNLPAEMPFAPDRHSAWHDCNRPAIGKALPFGRCNMPAPNNGQIRRTMISVLTNHKESYLVISEYVTKVSNNIYKAPQKRTKLHRRSMALYV